MPPAVKSPAAKRAAKSPTPKRAAKSPTPQRAAKSPARREPAASPAPKSTPGSTRQRKTPAKKAPEPQNDVPIVSSAAEIVEAPKPESPSKPKQKPHTDKFTGVDWMLLGTFIVFSAILVFGLASKDPTKSTKVKGLRVGKLSGAAFDDQKLLHSGGYHGSALVSFTMPGCAACEELAPTFRLAQRALQPAGNLRFAEVDCSKHDAVCTRFGVSGDEADANGYPHVVHFRDGILQGGYSGARSLEGFKQWAKDEKQL